MGDPIAAGAVEGKLSRDSRKSSNPVNTGNAPPADGPPRLISSFEAAVLGLLREEINKDERYYGGREVIRRKTYGALPRAEGGGGVDP